MLAKLQELVEEMCLGQNFFDWKWIATDVRFKDRMLKFHAAGLIDDPKGLDMERNIVSLLTYTGELSAVLVPRMSAEHAMIDLQLRQARVNKRIADAQAKAKK
jgi:hypothetical protein